MTPQEIKPGENILEAELEVAAEQGTVSDIEINETAEGYYVVAKVGNRKPAGRYLSTRREPETPRVFHHLERLYSLLREIGFHGDISLRRVSQYDPKLAAKLKAAAGDRRIKKVAKKKAKKKSASNR